MSNKRKGSLLGRVFKGKDNDEEAGGKKKGKVSTLYCFYYSCCSMSLPASYSYFYVERNKSKRSLFSDRA
jgi:hypothetical protein